MIFYLLSNNQLIWHITGYILYEIILLPLLFIIKYFYWIFIVIITTNLGKNIFDIAFNNLSISNNFNHSQIFIIYIACISISIVIFFFFLLFNIIKTYVIKDTKLNFITTIKWLIITLLIYPLLPIIFSMLLLLTSIIFNMFGFKKNLTYLNNANIANCDLNYNQIKQQILTIINNATFNKELLQLNTLKLNTNSFYYDNLLANITNYENFVLYKQNLFSEISQLIYNLKPNANNLDIRNSLLNDISTLNAFNNNLININLDLKNLNYKQLDAIKNFVSTYINFFNGSMINNLLFKLPDSLNSLLPHLGDIYQFNLIYDILSITGNNSYVISATPNFFSLNWNVLVAIIFSIAVLVILFLYCILEIKRVTELIILFLITPFVFLSNFDERNYYFHKWLKITFLKFFSLLLISLVFQTSILVYPEINDAINNNWLNKTLNEMIVDVICAISILNASFFSVNTILGVFEANESLVYVLSDLMSLKTSAKSWPLLNRFFQNKKWNKLQVENNASSNNSRNFIEITQNDILKRKMPVLTTGFEAFMASNKTHNFIKNVNDKVSKLLFGKMSKKITVHTNNFIDKSLDKKFKKIRMKEQKWKDKKKEGRF
ncbi:MAG: hypothetical protein IIT78_03700 [Mycoplasmataceae bacterium]|nr:hypothetical protein [Mycoplasmataceae bacterium]